MPSIAVAGLAYELYGPARFVLGLSPETWDIVFRANIGGGFLVGLPATVSRACVGLNVIPLLGEAVLRQIPAPPNTSIVGARSESGAQAA
jgi:hypothetical protein